MEFFIVYITISFTRKFELNTRVTFKHVVVQRSNVTVVIGKRCECVAYAYNTNASDIIG